MASSKGRLPADHDDNENTPVGYKSPPKHSRFRPGNVPHNKRLSEPEDFAAAAFRILEERRPVRNNGKVQHMSRMEALFRADVDRALNGNMKAMKRLMRLFSKYPRAWHGTRQTLTIVISGLDARV